MRRAQKGESELFAARAAFARARRAGDQRSFREIAKAEMVVFGKRKYPSVENVGFRRHKVSLIRRGGRAAFKKGKRALIPCQCPAGVASRIA